MSYATNRKLRIIVDAFGSDWKDTYPDLSIDGVYNIAVGDIRKTLYAKITPETKRQLEVLTDYNNITITEMLEFLINKEYTEYQNRCRSLVKTIKDTYSG